MDQFDEIKRKELIIKLNETLLPQLTGPRFIRARERIDQTKKEIDLILKHTLNLGKQ